MAKRVLNLPGEVLQNPQQVQYGIRSGVFSEADIRREYTALRDIAQKRLARLGASEYKESEFFKSFTGSFQKTGEIGRGDIATLSKALRSVSKFVESPLSTLSGQKKYESDMIQTLQERGYDFINRSNFRQFGYFMQHMRDLGFAAALYRTDDFEEAFTAATSGGQSELAIKRNFNKWIREKGYNPNDLKRSEVKKKRSRKKKK